MFHRAVERTTQVSFLLLFLAAFNHAFAQQGSVASLGKAETGLSANSAAKPEASAEANPESILASFVAAESKVRDALNQHTFKRDVVLQTIGPNGEVTGEYLRNSQFLFDDHGRRIEKVFFHPASTIHEMRITREDIQDLAGSQLLGIDIVEANKYRLSYGGIETIDSRRLFAIDVAPTVQPDPKHMSERYFVGRVWIDPNTFQILKIKGIVEPQGKQRFPIFETWREPSKNELTFPTRTEADDILHFGSRDVHYRIRVRYYEYKLFGSKVSITEIDGPAEVPDEDSPTTIEAATKLKPAAPSRKEASPKTKEAAPRASEKSANQSPLLKPEAREKQEVCTTNRNAPPVGGYHWPANSEVKVYFTNSMFTSEQSAVLLEAMKTWNQVGQDNGSGVKFVYAGETDRRMTCRGCLTVTRRQVYKQDKHHYAFFNPMQEEGRGLLVSAWIDLDVGITEPKALQGFMAHELGHGLGLWDCPSCKNKRSLMSSFPGLNKNNGFLAPSSCDVEIMKSVYQGERQIALATSNNDTRSAAARTEGNAAIPVAGLARTELTVLDLQQALVGGVAVARPATGKQADLVPVERTFAWTTPGFSEAAFTPSSERLPAKNPAAPKSPAAKSGETVRNFSAASKPMPGKSSLDFFYLQHPRIKRSIFVAERSF